MSSEIPQHSGSQKRAATFRRNDNLEQLLQELNASLAIGQDELIERQISERSAHPIVFIMGPLRSGTTLFSQWLAATGLCAYPTNLLSRFYGAPVVGAMIQLLLTDERYNFRNEILDFNHEIDFSSQNGKTTGALSPNEFWYFWRRFLPFKDLDWLPDEELLRLVDTENLVRELTALTCVFDKPFALKGMILNYNIPFLDQLFDNALFIQLKRDPIANVASVLEARKRQFGDENTWYSFKIPEYPQLAELDALHQAAGQVVSINRAVARGISKVDESRKIEIDYEGFCRDPKRVFDQLLSKLELAGAKFSYNLDEGFENSRQVDKKTAGKIRDALAQFKH